MREWIVTNACLVGRIVKSMIKWGGHMVRMKGDEITENISDKETRRLQKTKS